MSRRNSRSTRDSVRDLVEQEGLAAAAEALIEVCRDKKAPAPARATAGAALFRAGGLFEKIERARDKELHELTGEELAQEIARIRAERLENAGKLYENEDGADEEDDGVLD